jgi:hypothetical protein
MGRAAWVTFLLFAIVSFVGWLFVGLPIALFLPVRSITRLSWPLALVVGGVLGPFALLGALLTLASFISIVAWTSGHDVGITGLITPLLVFSLMPYTCSILSSSVSFGVYAAILRKQTRDRHSS